MTKQMVDRSDGAFGVVAYAGDRKTLLAFNLADDKRSGLCGFTIACKPENGTSYYLYNSLQFEKPASHAQVQGEPPYSSVNAPFHKFRWVHVPETDHQGIAAHDGLYAYTVTPRYCDANKAMLPLDTSLGVTVTIPVQPFTLANGKFKLGFTRGYVQSQGFVNHFTKKAKIAPDASITFDTDQKVKLIGGKTLPDTTYDQMYKWLGSTARDLIFETLDLVTEGNSLDVFAYDLNYPPFVKALKAIDSANLRVILDNANLHVTTTVKGKLKVSPEDEFEKLLGEDVVRRGQFGRYAHDKVLIVYQGTGAGRKPIRVLTGSTNFSVTGLCVNANHVLVFDDQDTAQIYADVFDLAWDSNVDAPTFRMSELSQKAFIRSMEPPSLSIQFSPHRPDDVKPILGQIVDDINSQAQKKGTVFFAVMTLDDIKKDGSTDKSNVVYNALNTINSTPDLISMGISDAPDRVVLSSTTSTNGVLATGKPSGLLLPAPFDQVPSIGLGHQVHHKFVVCGFNTNDAVVYCGSSNLAAGGEKDNGDNLLRIKDGDVATVFVIETLLMVDHFSFLDRLSKAATPTSAPQADKRNAATGGHWYLTPGDGWTTKYYNGSLANSDRNLFAPL